MPAPVRITGTKGNKKVEERSQPTDPGSNDTNVEFGRRIRRARMSRRWSHMILAHRMREVAVGHGANASLASLKVMLSKWEYERKRPNEYDRHLLAEALGVNVEELGLCHNPDFKW
jgi:transcriptional regulator with XRE-family HTH domain